ncbi:MAG: helix-turn-helix domain-containing protein, partial [Bacteroidetes bacterium]|nr:helix-turn-helix domain-containing protein [Fibrella sp.]
EQNVPPYVVFTDSTLEDMAKQRPTTPDGLRNVSGVGERKLQLFGRRFLEAIVQHVMGRVSNGEKPRGSTQLLTFDLYNKGMTLDEMATERQLTTASIVSHLAQLKQSGYDVDLTTLITPAERSAIEAAIDEIGLIEGQVKPLYEHLNGQYDYGRIRLVIALLGV